MAKINKQSNNYKFTVHMEETVLKSDPSVSTGAFAVVRDDNKAVVGNVSSRYGLVQNEALIDAARAQFDKMGFGGQAQEHFVVVGNGEKMYAEFTLKQSKATMLEVKKGDLMGYRVVFRNSFNGTQKVSLVMGFLRLICDNGMVGDGPSLSIMEKHTKKVDLSFLPAAIENAFAAAPNQINVFQDLASAGIDMEQGQRILSNLAAHRVMSERLRKAVEPVWLNPPFPEDSDRDLFNLYNAVTYVLTREVAKQRYERAGVINLNVLNALLRAARDTAEMNKLCVKLEKVESAEDNAEGNAS